MDLIYLDNNATTPLLPAVWDAMRPFAVESYGNPASAHQAGRRARRGLEDARELVAVLLGAHADEVIFTSGATEANNLALFGLCGDPPAQLIASPIEHPSVAEPLRQLTGSGFALHELPLDAQGVVDADTVCGLLRSDTRLIAVMLANHETGAVQSVRALAERSPGRAAFHCDATQAVGKLPVHFADLGVTSLSLSAHKFHGPKGAGALLLRRGSKLRPRTWGGHQQQGRRPGTEAVTLAVGLAAALDAACRAMKQRISVVRSLRERILTGLRKTAEPILLNGPKEGGLPHTINLSQETLGSWTRPATQGRRSAAHDQPFLSGAEGGRAVNQPRPGGRSVFGRLRVFDRLAIAVAGTACDGDARRCAALGGALQP